MKNILILIGIIAIIGGATNADNRQFKIDVIVEKSPFIPIQTGSGGFTASLDEWGRVSVLIYDNAGGMAISAAGVNAPTSHFNNRFQFTDSLIAIFDIYLKPTMDSSRSLVLEGVVNKMINVNPVGEPLFKYSEESVTIHPNNDNEREKWVK